LKNFRLTPLQRTADQITDAEKQYFILMIEHIALRR